MVSKQLQNCSHTYRKEL